MFEKLLREYDKMYNETEDKIHMVRIMTAEFNLCCRKQTAKETLIKLYEERRLE